MTKDLLVLQNISDFEFAIAGTPFHQETIKQITQINLKSTHQIKIPE